MKESEFKIGEPKDANCLTIMTLVELSEENKQQLREDSIFKMEFLFTGEFRLLGAI